MLQNTPSRYRPNVGIVLFNKDSRVFVGERIDTPGAWQMPQGGIDEGEDIHEAALRELEEEIGTRKAEILRISHKAVRYDFPPALRADLWDGLYRGQEQTWVAARFTGEHTDIDIFADPCPEFSDWQWVPLRKTLDLIVPFKRETYRQVIALFEDIVTD